MICYIRCDLKAEGEYSDDGGYSESVDNDLCGKGVCERGIDCVERN